MSKNFFFVLYHCAFTIITFCAIWFLLFMLPLGTYDRGLISLVIVPETQLGYAVYKTAVFKGPLLLIPFANLLTTASISKFRPLSKRQRMYTWIFTAIATAITVVIWKYTFEVNWSKYG